MASSVDQGFGAYGAKLFTKAAPYDPRAKTGGPGDEASYLVRPGVDFLRPWIAIENDIAFQWPLGVQGFDFTTDPVLGSHTFIGDNAVVLDVLHTGVEALTLTGTFPGESSPSLFQALREVVRRVAVNGKILFIPEVMSHAQRVQVSHFESSRDSGERGRTLGYSLAVQIVGQASPNSTPAYTLSPVSSTAANKGTSARTVAVNSTHRTLRQLALWKLGSAAKWTQIYTANEAYFVNHSIPKSQAPTHRLPLGLKFYY